MIHISSYCGGMVQTNGYLVEGPEGSFVVDAPQGISDWLKAGPGIPGDVLLTHQHYDHVEDAAGLSAEGASLHGFALYSKQLTLEAAARNWGMPLVVEPYQIRQLIAANSLFVIGGMRVRAFHIPGHSVDSLAFYLPDEAVLFAGDTLFAGSIGRCDLPGGSMEQLVGGIMRDLMSLPDETRVLSGHGPETTIGRERRGNPYLRG